MAGQGRVPPCCPGGLVAAPVTAGWRGESLALHGAPCDTPSWTPELTAGLCRKVVCACGYTREQHLEEAIGPHAFQGQEWDPKRHIQERPTDAFGDIVFTGLGQKMGKVGFCYPVALTADYSPQR